MSYQAVAAAHRLGQCEICDADLRRRHLAGGGAVDQCIDCGHLVRDLTLAPASHRSQAYGGEAHLDAARLALTYRALVKDGRPRSVFEIGFGAGSLLRRFHDDGARIAGADPDQLHLAVDEVVTRAGALHAGPVETLDLSTIEPVELAYGVHVLEHVEDPVTTMTATQQLLAPGGRAEFLTPAGDSGGLAAYGCAWWMLEDPTHVRFFSADSLARLAERAGFIDVEVRRPVLDSLSVDVASLVRLVAPAARPRGVLANRRVLLAGMASAPLVAAARLVRPRWRPTLHLIARKPG